MPSMQNSLLQKEINLVNGLMSTSEDSDVFIRDLKLSGYPKESNIVSLFIRTSVTLKGLKAKLIKGGFDINCSCILEKNGKVSVIIPSLDTKSSVRAIGKLRY